MGDGHVCPRSALGDSGVLEPSERVSTSWSHDLWMCGLTRQRDFAGMIKLSISRWEMILRGSGGTQYPHRVLMRGRQEGPNSWPFILVAAGNSLWAKAHFTWDSRLATFSQKTRNNLGSKPNFKVSPSLLDPTGLQWLQSPTHPVLCSSWGSCAQTSHQCSQTLLFDSVSRVSRH